MKTRLLPVAVCLLAVALPALAADWPQWRGPDRTNVSRETGLLQDWPKAGPPLVWTYKNTGLGFSTVAVVGDRLYTLGALKDGTSENEYLIALDVKGDKPREAWKVKLGPIFTFKGNTWGDGPRGTPTVSGKHVYALGGQGELVCAEVAGGKEVWRKNLSKDLGGEMMSEWGYSESPLIDGDLLICTPGGEKGTLAALDRLTGAVRWRSTGLKNAAPYSSVVVSAAGKVRQYVQTSYVIETETGYVSGFAAKDGKVLWTETLNTGKSYAIAPTPVVRGDLVYVTAGYDYGCHLFKLTKAGDKFKAEDQYSRKARKSMLNTHGGVVLVGDHIYGHSENLGWVCQEFKKGNLAWRDKVQLECTSGAITAADGRLYLFSDEGEAVLLEASPKGWKEHGRFTIPQKSNAPADRPTSRGAGIWTQPVVANGRLYLRDQELLFCFDVKAKK
jgi:outer membrane protein assembly factor BamB